MPPTRVVHVKKQPYDHYIGRANPRNGLKASIFANPFRGPNAIQQFREYILAPEQAWIRQRLPEIRGTTIACWCKEAHDCKGPKCPCKKTNPCHGDVLAELADKGVCK